MNIYEYCIWKYMKYMDNYKKHLSDAKNIALDIWKEDSEWYLAFLYGGDMACCHDGIIL